MHMYKSTDLHVVSATHNECIIVCNRIIATSHLALRAPGYEGVYKLNYTHSIWALLYTYVQYCHSHNKHKVYGQTCVIILVNSMHPPLVSVYNQQS